MGWDAFGFSRDCAWLKGEGWTSVPDCVESFCRVEGNEWFLESGRDIRNVALEIESIQIELLYIECDDIEVIRRKNGSTCPFIGTNDDLSYDI